MFLWSKLNMSVIRAEKVSKHYQLGKQTVQALNNIDLVVNGGEFIALAGPSGSGKTTLLNLIGCIDSPSSGSFSTVGRQGKPP